MSCPFFAPDRRYLRFLPPIQAEETTNSCSSIPPGFTYAFVIQSQLECYCMDLFGMKFNCLTINYFLREEKSSLTEFLADYEPTGNSV